MAPSDILSHYAIPSSASANGAIVAVVDLPSVNAMTDVNTYRSYYGIPTLPACPLNASGVPTPGGVACFARVGPDGTVNTLSTTDCPGWAGETALDIEMISAACPDCSIVVIEATDAYGTDLDAENPVASSVLNAAAVSNSWGGPESGFDDQSYYMATNIMVLAASGDTGYLMEDSSADVPSFPASSPYVLAVGGTTVGVEESVWDDDGTLGGGGSTTSGCSSEFAMPTYQSASPFHFGKCTMRAVADVSAAAEYYSGTYAGIGVYYTDAVGWSSFIGTSAASPLVAAIVTRLGLAGKDNHTLFYQNGGAFFDIRVGNNDHLGICTDPVMCTAGKFWDGPSGVGSPNGTLLLALAGGTLEPEPDAGPDAGPDGAGPPDSGVDATPDASDAGSEGGPRPPPHRRIGSPCSRSSQCAFSLQCEAPTAGSPTVCAPLCGNVGSCPMHYTCEGSYCFSSAAAKDAGTEPPPSNGSGSGCSCTASGARSSAGGAGWIALALGALAKRRSRRNTLASS